MEKFSKIKSIPAYLPIVNIDTDMIIPKQFLKTIKRTGLGKSLFFEMRYNDSGQPINEFILNQEPYNQSQILIADKNFGCGSSREHAPWALLDFGIRVVIAPSFADIFFNNCFKNGILPIVLPQEKVKELSEIANQKKEIEVDLEDQKIHKGDNQPIDFDVEYSRYNQDTFLITDKYEITVDYISILVEAEEQACTSHDVMNRIDEFQWRMSNVEGVQSAVSLPHVAKKINAGYNEGNPKWNVLPRTEPTLVQSIARIPSSSGLLNGNCSVMPVILFMTDHKAETITRIVDAVKEYRTEYEGDDLRFVLASGPVGVMAATNEAVSASQTPMLIYVFGAVIILCLLSFRSLRATISVVLPLYIVSVLAQALMTYLQIGLTVSTLPVIALGVGIGVDYGIYILSTMMRCIQSGQSVHLAYLTALRERGNAVLFTGITLAIGVSTWVFSSLKFQMDMGILLTFMFVVNMLGAIIVLPALARILWWKDKQKNV